MSLRPGTTPRDRERGDGEFFFQRRGDRPPAGRARGLRADLRPPRRHPAPVPRPPLGRRGCTGSARTEREALLLFAWEDLSYQGVAEARSDGGAALAIERGGEIAAFAYRRGDRIGPAAGVGDERSVTVRVPGGCASLLEALVASGFRIGDLAVFLASRPFGRPELYLPSGPILF
jgi:hypothetical protein